MLVSKTNKLVRTVTIKNKHKNLYIQIVRNAQN